MNLRLRDKSMPMRWRTLLFSVLLVVSGCAGSQAPAEPPREVGSAAEVWAAQNIRNYRFDFDRQCFCVREAVEPVTIEVREGVITRVRSRNTGEAMPASDLVTWYTVEDLFEQIREAQAAGIEPIRVQYHEWGYPLEIEIGSLAADAGVHYRVRNLEPLR